MFLSHFDVLVIPLTLLLRQPAAAELWGPGTGSSPAGLLDYRTVVEEGPRDFPT
jgi:hypothetical protein